jgi:hypothetical protein
MGAGGVCRDMTQSLDILAVGNNGADCTRGMGANYRIASAMTEGLSALVGESREEGERYSRTYFEAGMEQQWTARKGE